MKRVFAIFALVAASVCRAAEPWEEAYGALLKKYVTASGVRYAAWKANSHDYNQLIEITERIASNGPASADRAAQLAYYINAYNAWIVREVLQKYPIDGVAAIAPFFGVFFQDRIQVAGHKTSFDKLEKKVIIAQFREPRIHFAVNCASRSCPPLRNEAYTATRLNQQLDDATTRFVDSNPEGVSAIEGGYALSKIFDWYKADFEPQGGALTFINKYRKEPIPVSAKIRFQPYDWKLNVSEGV
jgi:Protein of unknown function, DUF547